MGIVVFAGPTLYGVPALAPVFERRGPAACGDVYRASLSRPRAIVLIDGCFDQTPSVWHKEILAVLASGLPVFGASSMGALRAVELGTFGMRGFGRVFDSFADGTLEDDDEVAVIHTAAEDGYRPLSTAMVDIRATLAAAAGAGVIGEDARAALTSIAKQLHFPDRSYGRVLADAAGRAAAAELGRLESWLPSGAVRPKRDDALALLAQIESGAIETTPPQVSFVFQRTQVWETLRGRIELEWAEDKARATGSVGAGGELAWRGALLRAAARQEAERRRTSVDQALLDRFVERFRRARGLVTAEAFDGWLASVGLESDAAIADFFISELLTHGLRARLDAQARAELANELRASASGFGRGNFPEPGVDE